MRAIPILLVVISAVAFAQDAAPQVPTGQPADKGVKIEFFWGEGEHIANVTQDKGIAWGESGEMMYLHKRPVLTNKDVVKVEVDKTVFGGGAIANEQYTLRFHLTPAARKRLAETCGPSGEKMLSGVIDGQSYGNPFYLKSRDETNFVPFAGMLSSKAKVDQIVETFAKAAPDPKVPASEAKSQAPAPTKK